MVYNAEACDRYRAKYPDRRKASMAKWKANNPERAREGQKKADAKYYVAHPEIKQAAGHRHRVAIRGGVVEKFTNLEIFERDNYICGICELPIDRTLKAPHPQSVSLDHIVPVVNGGHHTRANVQAVHLRCNLIKGSRV